MSSPRRSLRSPLWYPFTRIDRFEPSKRRFVAARGSVLVDDAGREIFDAVSSIWTVTHGHCHPKIAEAIARQAHTLDHATLLGASNPLAEELAERLTALTGTAAVLFASDGASAVEAALKLALQYWQARGEPQRRRFVHLRSSYHGDTAGAMSVSDIAVFKERFGAVTFETAEYQDAQALSGPDVAAVIVEPIVQAAAGMRIVEPPCYAALRDMTPLLIADEIATGFGRTGTLFAYEQLSIVPDLICAGKGITGGALALSATLTSERVVSALLASEAGNRVFYHGHSYAGNAIACAAALAALDLFDEEATLHRIGALGAGLAQRLTALRAHPKVRDVRSWGVMAGIELASEALDAGAALTPAWRIADALYARGHFTRPIGDTIQLVPPYCSAVSAIDRFFEDLGDELDGAD